MMVRDARCEILVEMQELLFASTDIAYVAGVSNSQLLTSTCTYCATQQHLRLAAIRHRASGLLPTVRVTDGPCCARYHQPTRACRAALALYVLQQRASGPLLYFFFF